jgi:tape measure domain-containing protein
MADKVGSVYIEIQAKMGSLEKDLKSLEAKLQGVDGKAQNTGSSMASMGRMIAGAGVTGAIIGLGKAALTAAAEMEKNRVAFTTMLGSAGKANKLLQEMTAFAANTPFQLNEIVDAGKSLLAFGFAADSIVPTMTKLGDVSAALNIPIKEMSELYGKARVQGTLYAEDLNQLAGRGIPIFTELAKVMGVNADQVKKMGSEGKIGFKELETAFTNMTKAGSQFGGLMAAQSQTLSGQWSNFNDALDQTAVLFGNTILTNAKSTLTVLTKIVQTYSEWLKTNTDLANSQEKYISLTDMATAGLSDTNEKLVAIYNQGGKNADYAALYAQYLQGDVKLSADHLKQIEQMIGLSRSLSDINYVTNKNELESWKQRGFIIEKIEGKTGKSRGKSGGKDKEDEANQRAYESRLVWLEKEAAMIEEYGSVENAEFVARLETKMQAYQQYTGVLTSMSGSLSQLSQMNAQNQTAEVDNRLTKEMEAIQTRYDAEKVLIEESLLTEEEKNAKLKALDEQRSRDEKTAQDKAAKEKRKIAHEAAKQQKMLAMFDTIIATPTAAFQAYKALSGIPVVGPGLGLAAAAATTALGLAKLKLISEQPLPALAQGGIVPAVPGGNQFTIGEAGSAEAVIPLNDNTLGRLAGMINNAGGGSQSMNITLNVDGETFGSWLYKATKNGQVTISSNGLVA